MKIPPWIAVILLLFCTTLPLHAQWLNHPTPGIPRTPDGRPDLAAPPPRTAEGKPDFSGVWGFDAGPSLFYIAGGLKPENVHSAVKLVKPYAVDVTSGVEAKPGQKDKALLKAFMHEIERIRVETGHTGPLSGQMQEWFEG